MIRAQVDTDELELPPNITVSVPDREHLDHFDVYIRPTDGLWKDATYRFSFKIPDSYPYKAPTVISRYPVYHPNFDLRDGHICLNILQSDWRPTLTVQQIVDGLHLLLLVRFFILLLLFCHWIGLFAFGFCTKNNFFKKTDG